MSPGDTSDGDLISTFVSTGDTTAFELLVRRHAEMVYRIARRMTADAHEAEDVAQAVFVKLAGRAAELSSHRSIAGWLYSTAWHVAARARRSTTRRLRRELAAAQERLVAQRGAIDPMEIASEEARGELYRAIEMLPPDLRSAIVLHHLQGHSVADVALVLGCPPGTVTARLSRGRSLLRERLAAHGTVLGSTFLLEILEAERHRQADIAVAWTCPLEEVVRAGRHGVAKPAEQVANGLSAATPVLAASGATSAAAGSWTPWASAVLKGKLARAAVVLLVVSGSAAAPRTRQIIREVRAHAAVLSHVTERNDGASGPTPQTLALNSQVCDGSKPKQPQLDPFDFGSMSSHTTSATDVPEPAGTSSLLLVAGAASLRRFRRRSVGAR